MMILEMSFTRISLGVLYTSITLIVLYILYRRLLAYMNKGVPEKALYCELNSLENDPARGELEFWFSAKETKNITFEILNADHSTLETVVEREFEPGQHIVRYDSTKLANGTYFYQLKTDNQQIMKKMNILN